MTSSAGTFGGPFQRFIVGSIVRVGDARAWARLLNPPTASWLSVCGDRSTLTGVSRNRIERLGGIDILAARHVRGETVAGNIPAVAYRKGLILGFLDRLPWHYSDPIRASRAGRVSHVSDWPLIYGTSKLPSRTYCLKLGSNRCSSS